MATVQERVPSAVLATFRSRRTRNAPPINGTVTRIEQDIRLDGALVGDHVLALPCDARALARRARAGPWRLERGLKIVRTARKDAR